MTATFKVRAFDGVDYSNEETVTLTVDGTNDAPVAVADINSVTEADTGIYTKTGITGDVINSAPGTDSDVDNLNSELSIVGLVSENTSQILTSSNYGGGKFWFKGEYGNILMDADGSYLYNLYNDRAATNALSEGEEVTEVFTYTVSDGQGGTDTATLTINITGTNDAPVISVTDAALAVMDEIDFLDNSTNDNYYKVIASQDVFDLLGISDVDNTNIGLSITVDSSKFYVNGTDVTSSTTNGIFQVTAANIGTAPAGASIGDFIVYSEEIDGLNEADLMTATFKVRAFDGVDYSNEETVTLTVDGTNDTITGTGVDGYIVDMTVFSDTTANLTLDSGEANTTTDSNGNFVLTGSDLSGIVVGYGGTDVSTGLDFEGIYKAPAGSTLLNPITTLIVDLMNEGKTLEEAQTLIKTNFGIDASVDLLVDPISKSVNAGTPAEATNYIYTQTVNAQVNNTVGQLAAALDGASITDEKSASSVISQELAKMMNLGAVDLTSDADIDTLISNVLNNLGVTLSSTISDDISDIIVNTNTSIETSTSGSTDAQSALESLAKTQIAAEETEQELEQGVKTNDTTTATANSTGTEFTNRVDAAETGAITQDEINTIQIFQEDSLFSTSGDIGVSLTSFNGITTFPTTQEVTLSYNDEDNVKVEIKVNMSVNQDGTYSISSIDGQDINQIPQGETARVNVEYLEVGETVSSKLFIDVTGTNDAPVTSVVHSVAQNDNINFAYEGKLVSKDVDSNDNSTYDWDSSSVSMTFSMTGLTGLSSVTALNNPAVAQAAIELKPVILDFVNTGNLSGLLTLSPDTIMVSKAVASVLKDFYNLNPDLKSEAVSIKDFILLNKDALVAQSTLSSDEIDLLANALSPSNITALGNLVDSIQLFIANNPGLLSAASTILADNVIDASELNSLDPSLLAQVDGLRLEVGAILAANSSLIDLIDIRTVLTKLDEISTIDSQNGEISITTSVNQTAAELMISVDENTGDYTITNPYFNQLPDSTNVEVSFDYSSQDALSVVSNTSSASILITPQNVDDIDISIDQNGVLEVADNQNIDMLNLLGNLSSNIQVSDIDSIDLTNGNHILSNLSVMDFEDMVSDSSNELSIYGDNGDTIKLDLSTWSKDITDTDLNPTVDATDDSFIAYTATGTTNQTLTLLIEKDITVEDI
ncbi:MAG: hypothetical protein C0625_15880 [Arcobacter sp.]|nr:MAG: hypothetical protein C0625_15880 [Arcobacter sp.]